MPNCIQRIYTFGSGVQKYPPTSWLQNGKPDRPREAAPEGMIHAVIVRIRVAAPVDRVSLAACVSRAAPNKAVSRMDLLANLVGRPVIQKGIEVVHILTITASISVTVLGVFTEVRFDDPDALLQQAP